MKPEHAKCKQCNKYFVGITDGYCSDRCRYFAADDKVKLLESENKLIKDTLHMWQKAYMKFHSSVQGQYTGILNSESPNKKGT